MSTTPKSQRSPTNLEADHHFFALRDSITQLMLLDFGFSEEKYQKQIERYREKHKSAVNVDEVVERYKRKCEAFKAWFIPAEREAIENMLRTVSVEFTMANSIFPSETAAKVTEYCQRRKHLNEAIAMCYAIKQEIQYVIRSLPVDLNKYKAYDKAIKKQIALYKGIRRADNRFLRVKNKKG